MQQADMQSSDKHEVSSSGKPLLSHGRHFFIVHALLGSLMHSLYPSDLCHVKGGDSAWEKVSNFAESGEDTPSAKDDYAALTAQLAATGPAGGTRAKARRPAAAVRLFLLCTACHCMPSCSS